MNGGSDSEGAATVVYVYRMSQVRFVIVAAVKRGCITVCIAGAKQGLERIRSKCLSKTHTKNAAICCISQQTTASAIISAKTGGAKPQNQFPMIRLVNFSAKDLSFD
jgi:hypothetical protein